MKRLERTRAATPVVVAATLALVLCADVHSQQPAPPAAGGEPVAKTEVTVTDAGTFELHVQGTDIRKVLQLLSTRSETNIIATKDVAGTVTADLYDVTFAEALEAVLKSAGFEYIRKGNFVYVMTPKEKTEREAALLRMTVKVFKLNYITAADAKTLVTPVLSQKGVVSTSPDAAGFFSAAAAGPVRLQTSTAGSAIPAPIGVLMVALRGLERSRKPGLKARPGCAPAGARRRALVL